MDPLVLKRALTRRMKGSVNQSPNGKKAGIGWKPIAFGCFLFVAAMLGMLINLVAPHVASLFAPPPECIVKLKQAAAMADYNESGTRRLFREAYELTKEPSTTPFNRAQVTYEYGKWLWLNREFEQALPMLRESIPACKAAGYPLYAASAMELVAGCQHELGKSDDATAMCEAAIKIREQNLGKSHCYLADSLNSLGESYVDSGKPDKASAAFTRSLAIIREAGDKKPCDSSESTRYRAYAEIGLAEVSVLEKKLPESEKQLHETIAFCDQQEGPGSSLAENLLRDYVKLLHKLGYADRANFYNNKLDNPFVLRPDRTAVKDE